MNSAPRLLPFDKFIDTYRRIAGTKNLNWEIAYDAHGSVEKCARWDLCSLTGTPKPPEYHLTDLGTDRSTLDVLNREWEDNGLPTRMPGLLSRGWQDLLKAMTVRALFERGNGARHIYVGVLRPIRALATCCPGKEPWELTAEDVSKALQILGNVDENAKLRSLVEAQVITLDENSLARGCPLLGNRRKVSRSDTKRTAPVRQNLEDRRRTDRLPGARESGPEAIEHRLSLQICEK